MSFLPFDVIRYKLPWGNTHGVALPLLGKTFILQQSLIYRYRASKAKTVKGFFNSKTNKAIVQKLFLWHGLDWASISDWDQVFFFCFETLGQLNRFDRHDDWLNDQEIIQYDGYRRTHIECLSGNIALVKNPSPDTMLTYNDLYIKQFIAKYKELSEFKLSMFYIQHPKIIKAILELFKLTPNELSINHLHSLFISQPDNKPGMFDQLTTTSAKAIGEKEEKKKKNHRKTTLSQEVIEVKTLLSKHGLSNMLNQPYDACIEALRVLAKDPEEEEAKARTASSMEFYKRVKAQSALTKDQPSANTQ